MGGIGGEPGVILPGFLHGGCAEAFAGRFAAECPDGIELHGAADVFVGAMKQITPGRGNAEREQGCDK
jgi:hypothetical protein